MRMAELAERSRLSVPTIKYYLREGLLHPGRRVEVNQALYDDTHLERLRLIRALATVAGLPLAKVRDVVAAISSDPTVIEAMAVTQDALVTAQEEADATQEASAGEWLARHLADSGWAYEQGSPAHRAAVKAVADLQAEGLETVLDQLDGYVGAAGEVARLDVEALKDADALDVMMRTVVLGSVLRRPLLESLVLLAQQHYGARLNAELGGHPSRPASGPSQE